MSPRPPHALTPRRLRVIADVFFTPTMSDALCPRCKQRYLPIRGKCICEMPFEHQLGHSPAAIAARAARALARRKGES